MNVFVVADAHGRYDLVEGLLEQAEILDDGVRTSVDPVVVSLGDLCNCMADSTRRDLVTLDYVREWFDVYLVGNHEHPHLSKRGGFFGFFPDTVIRDRLRDLNAEGFLQPSFYADGILYSHAGLTAGMAAAEDDHPGWEDAAIADEELHWAWTQKVGYSLGLDFPVFSLVGRKRGGRSPYGGILWADWSEPKTLAFSQIVGHTPGKEIRWASDEDRGTFALCLDLGAGFGNSLAGAWVCDGEVEPVIYSLAGTKK